MIDVAMGVIGIVLIGAGAVTCGLALADWIDGTRNLLPILFGSANMAVGLGLLAKAAL